MPDTCLLVGLGDIGMGYDIGLPGEFIQTHARALSLYPGFILQAAVEPDAGKRKIFTEHYGYPAFGELGELPADLEPDIVIVATPTPSHARVVSQVLERFRPRLMLCEKPLGGSLEAAREIVESCKRAGTDLYVNYIRLADPGVQAIKGMIEAGDMGPEFKGVAWYSKGLVHNGSHFVNLAEYWFGEVTDVQVFDQGRSLDSSDREPGFALHFERACIIFQAAWEESCSFYGMEIVSPSGRLLYERGGEHITWQVPEPDPVLSGHRRMGVPREIENGLARYQWHVAGELGLASAGNTHHLCTAEAAVKTRETLEYIMALSRRAA